MRPPRVPLALPALAALLCAFALSGCAGGGATVLDTSQPPAEQAHEVVAHLEAEGGEAAVEKLEERRGEYEEAQQEREEQPGEAGEQAVAEGAEVRDAVQAHEEEREAAEEAEEQPEREPRSGRV